MLTILGVSLYLMSCSHFNCCVHCTWCPARKSQIKFLGLQSKLHLPPSSNLRLLPTFVGALWGKKCALVLLKSWQTILRRKLNNSRLQEKYNWRDSSLKEVLGAGKAWNDWRFCYWIYWLSNATAQANCLYSLIHKSSINESVSGSIDVLIGCLDSILSWSS